MLKWLENLRLSGKVLMLAAVMLVFLTSLGLLGLRNMATLNRQMEVLYNVNLQSVDHWGQIHAHSVAISTHVLNHIASEDAPGMLRAERSIKEEVERIEGCLAELKQLPIDNEEQELLRQYEDAYQSWEVARDRALNLSKMGDKLGARQATQQAINARDQTISLAMELQRYNREEAEKRFHMSNQAYAISIRNFIVIMLIASGLALILSLGMGRIMGRPLEILEKASQQVAGGNLTTKWVINSKDEIGDLSRSFSQMVTYLRELISTINDNALHVSSASEQLSLNTSSARDTLDQITASIQELANGANEQASTAQSASEQTYQIAQAMGNNKVDIEAIVAATKKVEELIKNGLQAITEQNSSVEENANAARGVGKAINNLAREVQEVGVILTTISQIAQQTNLLALNAAIEAARAGEHGRGFAVVAEEVRKLAEESAQATGQINQIITSVQEGAQAAVLEMSKAGNSVEAQQVTVKHTSEVFQMISDAIGGMVERIEHMASASEEVNASLQSITEAIKEIASVSEENAASVEQIAASTQQQSAAVEEMAVSASSLDNLAHELERTAQRFTV